jgi:hypothetical protein
VELGVISLSDIQNDPATGRPHSVEQQALRLDRFLSQIDWGGLPRAAVGDSIRRYAGSVDHRGVP